MDHKRQDNGTSAAHQNGGIDVDTIDTRNPIAIIGMSCKFPGDATSPQKLWQLVAEGRSAWSEIPSGRFNQDAFYHPSHENVGTSNVRGSHFLSEDVSLFDASFFNFSTEVASSMDPQYRLQLESTFEALESAGLPISSIAGTDTSVFAGAFFRDYHDSLMRDPEQLPRYFMTGNGAAMISNRISHFFDLQGPSMTLDTGCSTGLTALHLGCQSIRAGESKVSIIGGSNVMINPDMFISMSMLGLLGADGKSYSFDSRGSGYGRGEGVATVVLKPLNEALAHGDPIRAVIRATALNQDGKTPTITSPSQLAQETLIRSCYHNAGLNPLDTSYVEAHGTGTRTGDPIEAGAIGKVFGRGRPSNDPLWIGSVKSNIGHLEAASGLASIIKTAMILEKGLIPPSINYENPNPDIDFEALKLRVPTQLEEWPADRLKRASVSNFGYGGTNAHVIMDDASYYYHRKPQPSTNGTNGHDDPMSIDDGANGHDHEHPSHIRGQDSHVFVLSAKDEGTIRSMLCDMRDYLETQQHQAESFFQDLAFSLGQRRSRFPWTIAACATDVRNLSETLGDALTKPTHSTKIPRLGFVFNGQGAQWYAMGRELMVAYPVFLNTLTEAERFLKVLGAPWSLIDELTRSESESRVHEASLSLPLSCAIQLALVDLLRSWGIFPSAVTGHSSGEVGAAYAAGAIDIQQALSIVYVRGALTTQMIKRTKLRGGMLAVGLGPEDAQPYLSKASSGKAVIACVNSPASVTISGDLEAIEAIKSAMDDDGVFARKLKVEAAYHSHHMKLISKEYLSSLKKTLTSLGDFDDVVYSSPVSGEQVETADHLAAQHWVKNMVQPVLFSECFKHMCIEKGSTQRIDAVIEIGPHGALAGPIRQNLSVPELKAYDFSYHSCLSRGQDAVQTMQSLVCALLGKGFPVDLAAVNFPRNPTRLHVIPDLPPYPWNHSVRHWVEPRINREYRHRKFAPHDLLGSPIAGNNAMAPTWRHIIRSSEVPWVREHMVQSDMVYPGAGCIIMAVEAVRQSSSIPDRIVSGYMLREIEISKALIVPDTLEGVEVQLALRKCSDKGLDTQDWQEFRVYSVDGDGVWSDHCSGLICKTYQDNHHHNTSNGHLGTVESSDNAVYTRRIDPKDFFQSLRAIGINHGPSFQNLESIRAARDKSIATLKVTDTAALMPSEHQSEHLIHPITLDALFQAAYSAVSPPMARQMGAAIPRSIKTMFISNNIESSPGHSFQTSTILRSENRQGFDVAIALSDADDAGTGPVLEIDGMHYQSLGNSLAQNETARESKLSLKFEWQNDLSMMNSEQLKPTLMFSPELSESTVIEDLKRATSIIIRDTIDALSEADIHDMHWYHRQMFNWMLEMDVKATANQIAPSSSRWARTTEGVKQFLFEKVSNASINGKMLCHVGQNLPAILRKEISPLELMLEDKLLYTYYEQALRVHRSLVQVGKLVQPFAHMNPRARILEIGGGTGACTGTVLKALGGGDPDSIPRFARYDFTDISSGFFEEARDKFRSWGDLITYQKLDIEQDLVAQGFDLGSYDLIIACQVLHATKAMEHTMRNVHSLLKPGGKLLMVETTQDAFDVCLVFGTLEGWWLSEERERKLSPNLPLPLWERVLERTGFELDVEVRDSEDSKNYAMSVIMATALSDAAPRCPTDVAVVYSATAPPVPWLKSFVQSLKHLSPHVTMGPLESINADAKVCIFLGEIQQPMLAHMDSSRFYAIKRLLNGVQGLFWVTRGASIECNAPEKGLHTGLLRTLRLEDSGKRFVTLDLDPGRDPWTAASASAILSVFGRAFNTASEPVDYEFAERDSILRVPRICEDNMEDDGTAADTDGHKTEKQPFKVSARELRMEVGTPGMLDTLVFNEVEAESLPDDFVEIEPLAFGLNFRDIMVAMGQLQEKIMGFECGGVITRLGPSSTHDLKVGDHVCALTTKGHWASFIRVPWTSVAKIPDHMTFEAAASIPMVFVTAWFSLVETARLQASESVLIHAGSGGVGQAAIIIAKHIGSEIFVTVGTAEKREFIMNTYGIDSGHIMSSRDPSFAAGIRQATQGKGVDVVLNSLSGLLLHESWNSLATLGRFVEIGKRDIQANKNLSMEAFGRGLTFAAVDLIHLGNCNGPLMSKILRQVLELLGEKSLVPIQPVTVYPISEIQRAFRTMQAGKHLGKIVIKPNPDDQVPVRPRVAPIEWPADASYIIVGGLGGIGRSTSQWFAQSGAKNLILLSRSAASQPDAKAFVKELEGAGCRVEVRNCDIADAAGLAKTLKGCMTTMPPVQGIVQAAMVLQDSVFERMSFEKWQAAIRPKVQGTINLHNQFADAGLKFFIMLSSATGILGNPSQANYAAGSTFQDAFARQLSSKGIPAVSIDLGMVKSVGYVAETAGVAERLARIGYRPLEEEEVLRLIEAAIRHPTRPLSSSQIVTGLAPFEQTDGIAWRKESRFLALKKISSARYGNNNSGRGTNSKSKGFKEILAAAPSWPIVLDLLTGAIITKLSEMFMLAEAEVDKSMPLSKYGVDSLVAVELRNWLGAHAHADVSLFDVLQSASLEALAVRVAKKSKLVAEGVAAAEGV